MYHNCLFSISTFKCLAHHEVFGNYLLNLYVIHMKSYLNAHTLKLLLNFQLPSLVFKSYIFIERSTIGINRGLPLEHAF